MHNKVAPGDGKDSSSGKSIPKDAATVILVREGENDSWEIFLARRHSRQSFMAGAYVFPGGQLEDNDYDQELAWLISVTDGFSPRSLLQDAGLTTEKALGFFIGAIRETFEETGIFLAGDLSGRTFSFAQKETFHRFAGYRQKLNKSEITLKNIARKEKLLFLPELLIPYSHWITPDFELKRFTVRFFLAKLPEGQMPITDAGELTESLWSTPKNALEMHAAGKILLMPPTLKTIEELSVFNSCSELFAAGTKKVIYPILPQLIKDALILPHDPEYSIARYKKPADPHSHSRFLMQDGRWKTAFYDHH